MKISSHRVSNSVSNKYLKLKHMRGATTEQINHVKNSTVGKVSKFDSYLIYA